LTTARVVCRSVLPPMVGPDETCHLEVTGGRYSDVMSNVASTFSGRTRTNAQWRMLARGAHPVQAGVLAVVIGALALYSDRTFGQSLVAAAAVLLVQLAAGLLNDLFDAPLDRRGKAAGKPFATGLVPRGNVTFAIWIVVLLSIPVSLENGTLAGLALLATLPVAYVHNRILHRTAASFVGWMVTFALFPVFLAYGGWGSGRHGDDPAWQFMVVCAFVGLCVHFLTTLPDLVVDHASGVRNLPLLLALKIGAPRLLIASCVLSVIVAAMFIVVGLNPGLRV
jgi:4-hydroxybenzoate polyprenyltransferase